MHPNTQEPESHDTGAWKQHLGNWGAYAAAAGAALAMATNASADSIVSHTLDLTVSNPPGPAEATFSVGGVGVGLFVRAYDRTNVGRQYGGAQLIGLGTTSGGPNSNLPHLNFRGIGASGTAKRYTIGQPILAGAVTGGLLFEKSASHGVVSVDKGLFGPGASNGFVGFSNAAGDLGWMHVQVGFDSGGYPDQLEVISWAYNDVAGAAIDAGQTSEGPATPEPSTAALGLLALGAAGILALRKRRHQVSKVTQG
jgi:MYXO-CTERM domain-containing protein